MGMPITVILADSYATQKDCDAVFAYFQAIDNQFSTYKKESEISLFNKGEIQRKDLSKDMKLVFRLANQTTKETNGYFNIVKHDGSIDPSGLVKGWAIYNACKLLAKKGFKNFSIDAGGDVQVAGKNEKGEEWRIGIRNPFNPKEIIKVVGLTTQGIATSGTYVRGQHIYDPHQNSHLKGGRLENVVSVTVIGKNVYEADRFATAVFAMQSNGIYFLEKQNGLEGYMIDKHGIATMTSGFNTYVI